MAEKLKGHGDWANIIRDLWPANEELQRVRDEIVKLEQSPGFAYLSALLDARQRFLFDRLVVGDATETVRATDHRLGTVHGLQQSQRAIDSIIHEANQARERAERAAREADEEAQPA